MITLAASQTIAAKAGTASAVVMSLFGDEITTTDSFLLLNQTTLGNTAATVFTSPSSTATLVKKIFMANVTGSTVTVNIYANGTTSSQQIWQATIPANGSASYDEDGWHVYDASGFLQYVGSTGPQGNTGSAATIAVGTTTTLTPGSAATVSNSGTSSAATFNFGVPGGANWQVTVGVPGSGVGANGDYALNSTTGDLYGPKASGSWGSIIGNIKGAAGSSGSNGTNGSVWYNGAGVPSGGTGVNGDYYLNVSNGDVYAKSGGSWGSPIANLKGAVATIGAGAGIVTSTAGSFSTSNPGVSLTTGAYQKLNNIYDFDADFGGVADLVTVFDAATGPVYRGAGTPASAGTGTTVAPTVPSTAVTGDILVCVITSTGGITSASASGWTATNTANGVSSSVAILTKTAAGTANQTSTDAGTAVTVTESASGAMYAVIFAVGNTAGVDVQSAGAQNGGSTTPTPGAVTTTVANDLDVICIGYAAAATTATPPANYGVSYNAGSGSTSVAVVSATQLQAATGTTGTPATTMGASVPWVAYMITFKPLATLSMLTCPTSAPFSSYYAGKRITVARAGASQAQLTTTIASVINAQTVTLTAAASLPVVQYTGCSFGTDNSTAFTALQNAVNNAVYGGVVCRFGQSGLQNGAVTNGTWTASATGTFTNSYGTSTQVTFNKTCMLQGVGGTTNHDTGDYTKGGGTRIAWWGTSSDGGTAFRSFFTWLPITGATAQSVSVPQIRDLWLDCRNGDQNQALGGIDWQSVSGGRMDDIMVVDALAYSYYLRVVSPSTTSNALGEARDSTRGMLSNIRSRQLDGPNAGTNAVNGSATTTSAVTLSATPQTLNIAGTPTLPTTGYVWIMTNAGYPVLVNYTGATGGAAANGNTPSITALTGCSISAQDAIGVPATVSGCYVVQAVPGNGAAMILDGDYFANACCATMINPIILHGAGPGPAAIEMRNCDSWEIFNPVINGGNNTTISAINRVQKPGVRLNGSLSAQTNGLGCRNNCFYGGSPGAGGISAMALTSAGALLATISGPNYWDGHQTGNGEPLPTIEVVAASATQATVGAIFNFGTNGALMGPRDTTKGISATGTVTLAATASAIPGTVVPIPPQGFQLGTTITWRVRMSKTAAGTGTNTFHIRAGTTGVATTDTAYQTSPASAANTAAIDVGILEVSHTITATGASTNGNTYWEMRHAGAAAAGLGGMVPAISASSTAINSGTAQQFLYLSALTSLAGTVLSILSTSVTIERASI